MPVTVYGIRIPGGPIRYIGQTRQSLAARMYQHKSAADKGSRVPLAWWLRKHKNEAEIFIIKASAIWNVDEVVCILLGRAAGLKLLNVTGGGDGKIPGHVVSLETRAKLSAALKGRVYSSETISRMSKAQLGKAASVLTKARMSAARTGMVKSAETRRKISESLRGQAFTAQRRVNISSARRRQRGDS